MPDWDDVPDQPLFSKAVYQHGYEKGDPDPDTFAPIPKDTADAIGFKYGDYSRLHALVLSLLIWHANRSRKAGEINYRGHGGVGVPEGMFVLSMQTAAENIYAYLFSISGRSHIDDELGNMRPGFRTFYEKIRNCFGWLEGKGYVQKGEYVGGDAMKGTFWSFTGTELEEYIAGADIDTVDVRSKIRQIFLDMEADRFTMAEACTSKYQRHRYLPAQNWNEVVAKEGADQDRHVSIGSFLPEDTRKGITEDRPTAIPYVVLEPEQGDILERHEATHRILDGLHADGADLSRVIVSFSGNNSFHIRIPAGMFGSKVFRTVDAGRRTISRWTAEYVGEDLDVGLFDARHLIRMIGSRHEKSGRYVTGFSADEFMGLTIAEIADRSKTHEPFAMSDPFKVAVCEELAVQFADAADSLTRFYIPPWDEVDEHPSGGSVTRALEGVSEGDTWHDKHQGRNKAAYIVACYLLKQDQRTAWDELLQWNTKNDPPLAENELRHCFRSATRTIQKENSAPAENV